MRKLNLILLAIVALSSVGLSAQQKSPTLLLNEAIYAEQTEGDLEKAINLYEQVLEQHHELERLAARATYQLGNCYLKKGDKKTAAEYFQDVINDYPQQKIIARKAKTQLDKLDCKSSSKDNFASAKPTQLEPVPWVDGEVMELRLKRPSGIEYGTLIFSAQKKDSDSNIWQIVSNMYITQGSFSQYTLVEADDKTFAPSLGQTINALDDFKAEYQQDKATLHVDSQGKKMTRDIPLQTTAYDNEQAVHLIRRLPLAQNYECSFPIFAVQSGITVECRIKVLGIEQVAVAAGTFDCYKVDLSIYYEGNKTLQHTLWFSKDSNRYLVKYDIGGVGTLELTNTWQLDDHKALTFENNSPKFKVKVPADWRYYKYATGCQTSLQMLAPQLKSWNVLVWQRRGTDPASASAMTIAKADSEILKGFFENYTIKEESWQESEINGLKAAQYYATYTEKGSGLASHAKPKEMVEYRTYIVDDSNVYWFVIRVAKEKFEESKSEFDYIIQSFKRPLSNSKAESKDHKSKPETKDLALDAAQKWLDLIDSKKYSKSWTQASSFFKESLTRNQWARAVKPVRNPLGKLISRKLKSSDYTKTIPGAADGEFYIITFKTSYENMSSATETITLVLDKDGTWRVSGYLIN